MAEIDRSILDAAGGIRVLLDAAEVRVAQDKKYYHAVATIANQINRRTAEVEYVDVGGTPFHTCRSTLISSPESIFASIFSGHFANEEDEGGYVFLDRDPRYFHYVLQYLRDKEVPSGLSRGDRLLLRREAKYYGVPNACSPPSQEEMEQIFDRSRLHVYGGVANAYGEELLDIASADDSRVSLLARGMLGFLHYHGEGGFMKDPVRAAYFMKPFLQFTLSVAPHLVLLEQFKILFPLERHLLSFCYAVGLVQDRCMGMAAVITHVRCENEAPAITNYMLGMHKKARSTNSTDGYAKIATERFTTASLQGSVFATYELAFCYLRWGATAIDVGEAIRLFRLAAGEGHAGAQYELGWRLFDGSDAPKDTATAVRLLRLSADQGNADAQYTLAYRLIDGKDVPRDTKEAARLLHLAADQGHHGAHTELEALILND